MAFYIGLDLGGTNIRAALFEGDEIVERAECLTRSEGGPEAVISHIIDLMEGLAKRRGVQAAGLGLPGIVNDVEGTVRIPPNLPGWDCVDVKSALGEAFEFPVYIANDANLFALGEWAFGAGKGFKNIVALTLGTGVGGGVIVEGRLLLGSQYAAAELGHISINFSGPECKCGSTGCLEAYLGGAYFDGRVREKLAGRGDSVLAQFEKVTPEDAYEAALQGDALALEIWEDYGFHLGVGIAGLLNVFDPEVVILGGRIARALRFFRQGLEKAVYLRWMGFPGRVFRLEKARLGDDAALYGGLYLASHEGQV